MGSNDSLEKKYEQITEKWSHNTVSLSYLKAIK
jgi:hypothetical protein